MAVLLTIESTCDETAAAVVTDQLQVLAAVVASQEALHGPFAGVVPEIAARAHVEQIVPTIDQTLRRAGCALTDLDAIAVAHTPGLAGSLLVGLMAAKALCLATNKPLITVNHLHAHVYACRLAEGPEVFPCVGLIVSGGHTLLYDCASPTEFCYLGGTIDDAAGEAFDKVAAMLGLPYPGGPSIAKAAEGGDPTAYRFPRGLSQDRQTLDFSFSGLKTAVRYALFGYGKPQADQPPPTPKQVADLAASFQEAVVDALVSRSLLALQKTGRKTLCVGGGVAANRRLRQRLAEVTQAAGVRLAIAPPQLCTDNAVMGAIAFEKLRRGQTDPLDVDIVPGLVRG